MTPFRCTHCKAVFAIRDETVPDTENHLRTVSDVELDETRRLHRRVCPAQQPYGGIPIFEQLNNG